MESEQAGDPGGVSVRLIQILRIYGGGLSPHTLADLRDVVRAGRYPWLHDEFEAAIRTGAFSAGSWCSAVGVDVTDQIPDRTILDQQRFVWAAIFEEPFPEPHRSRLR